MKNYKIIKNKKAWSFFGDPVFDDEQLQKLEENGFKHEEFPWERWTKNYCYDSPYGWIEMILPVKENEYLRFFQSRFLMPCELSIYLGKHYKNFMKVILEDIKKLKEINIIK